MFIVLQVLDQNYHELRSIAMSTLCAMVTQLGQRYKIFIPTVKKVRSFTRVGLLY